MYSNITTLCTRIASHRHSTNMAQSAELMKYFGIGNGSDDSTIINIARAMYFNDPNLPAWVWNVFKLN